MLRRGADLRRIAQDAPVGTAFEICASVDFFNGRPSPKIESARKLSDEETAAEMPFLVAVSKYDPAAMKARAARLRRQNIKRSPARHG